MAEYRVHYKVLPDGVGPDDYESKDLEGGELVLELSDPEPAGFTVAGQEQSYGPHVNEVKKAVIAAAQLEDGEEPIVLSWNLV